MCKETVPNKSTEAVLLVWGQLRLSMFQFCQVLTYHDTGNVRMHCSPVILAQTVCDPQLPHCSRTEDFLTHSCFQCCPNDTCVQGMFSLMPSPEQWTSQHSSTSQQLSSQKPTTSQLPSTNTETASADTTTSSTQQQGQDICVDIYGGCSTDFTERCSESDVQEICQKTCGVCETAATLATSPAVTAPQLAGSCYSCSGLDCIVNPTEEECPDHQCMTIVDDTEHGREIARRCATQDECDGIELMEVCRDPDHAVFRTFLGVTCQYCCNEWNCNSPPDILPVTGLITYH
ncbi:hypothetical protein BaRGS_00021502 [Batillaria attramentaria]|uniref:Uncharacterized protein n=1 Tax=Batillaria attramentaria TaxID=370345 RepID=A0ABD0KJD9_9CAEN